MPDSEYASALASGAYERRNGLKRLLPGTLFGRALLIMVTPVVLTQLVATWIFYERHWENITRRLGFAVAAEIALVIDGLEHAPDRQARTRILDETARAADLIITIEPGARLPADRTPPASMVERTLGLAISERVQRPFSIDSRLSHEWYEIRVELTEGVLRVLTPGRRLFSPTTYIFILWMLGSALVLFAIAIAFMRNQIRSIRRLASAADSFGKGLDVPDFRPEGANEVRLAAAAFLVMRERIQRQMRQRTEMLAGVSHDLRTPLTRMKLALAMLGESQDIEELKGDVDEMETMIEAYLAFARGEGTEPAEPADLGRLLGEVAVGARRAGGRVDLAVADDLTLPLRVNAFRRCLANLLANSRRHADSVWLSARRRDPVTIEIVFDDDGPGIPEHAREDVFKPFFRLESSRNSETGGTGLGLAIARDIVRSHGGEITLADSPQGGLRVIIRLPV
ncbi:MAG: ATP-binding protein [Rhodospirillaceae bacterium]